MRPIDGLNEPIPENHLKYHSFSFEQLVSFGDKNDCPLPTVAPDCYNASAWKTTSRFIWQRRLRAYRPLKANSPMAATTVVPTAVTTLVSRRLLPRFCARASAREGSGVMSLCRHNSSAS